MSDRLKLSDPNGDAEVDRIAVALAQKEDADHLRTLQKNIAALQEKLAKQKANGVSGAEHGSNNKVGARKHASFMAISTAPSINWTPLGPTKVPIAYPTVQDLSSSVNTARTVNFNGCSVYLLDASTQPHCTGDERGTAKGIKSGTVSGEVKPVKGSSTVRIEGKQVVRDGDPCTMNGGNNPGVYVMTCSPSPTSPKDAISTSNPSRSGNGTAGRSHPTPSWDRNDPLGLTVNQTPAEKLALLMQEDAFTGRRAQRLTDSIFRNAPVGPTLTPLGLSDAEASQQRTRNSLTIALLGPYGAPGVAARISGASENRVEGANDIGAAAMGVALSLTGMPGRQPINIAANNFTASGAAQAMPTGAGVRILGSGTVDAHLELGIRAIDVEAEITALRKMAVNLGGATPGQGERSLTKEQYRQLISKYRNAGDKLQAELEATIARQSFVYRATTLRAVEIYRANGRISGRSGGVYMSSDYVGLDSRTIMDRSQVFERWGVPEVLLRIPASEIDSAVVPRPFGGSLNVGWEPRTAAYPAAGSGDMHQFLGTTRSWSESWIIPLKGAK